VLENESFRERNNFRSRERKFSGTKVPVPGELRRKIMRKTYLLIWN